MKNLNLQLFAEKPATVLNDSYEDVIVEEDTPDNVEVDDELNNVDNVDSDEDLDEDIKEDSEEDDVDTEDADDEDNVDDNDTSVKFDNQQQKELNRILKTRLERQESKLLKDLSSQAGTEITTDDVNRASVLWGLLKENPNLSRAIDQVIDQHLKDGKAKAPETKIASSKEAELEVKEAVLDLKLADKTFNKNSDKILKWADDQGFEVTNKKSLQLAYMAWKGSQAKVVQATQKLNEQKKQATKKAVRQKAAVQSGKSSKSKGKLDFTKMSDADVLTSSGLSLFVED